MNGEFDRETLGRAQMPDPVHIGAYNVMDAIARNDFSTVYRCNHPRKEGLFAVKLLSIKWSEHAFRHVFVSNTERIVGQGIAHCVPVLEVGLAHERPYVVMPFLNGHSMADIAKRRPLRPSLALRCIGDAAKGLKAMHRQVGLLHGDVQPKNLIFSAGEVTVLGFGQTPPTPVSPQKTVVSTPHYLAPEAIEHGRVDVRTDIYALGCTLFHLLTRDPPYGSGPGHAQLAAHLHEPFPLVKDRNPNVPDDIDRLLQQMCAKDPGSRLQSYDAVINAAAAVAPALSSLTAEVPMVLIEVGRDAGKSIGLAEGDTLLGRQPGEGIVVDDGRVSRRHAVLKLRGSTLEIRDLDSRNGIKVNGRRRKRSALLNDDRITLGDTVLRVMGIQGALEETETADMPVPPIPISPVRGAFGEAEVAHAPSVQAKEAGLTTPAGNAELEQIRVQLLGQLSVVLSGDTKPGFERALVDMVKPLFKADAGVFMQMSNDQPVLAASTADEASLLSSVLPAVERATAGRLSLCTTVRVGRDNANGVLLCPFVVRQGLQGFFILSKKTGRFDAALLPLLEGAAFLLARRAEQAHPS